MYNIIFYKNNKDEEPLKQYIIDLKKKSVTNKNYRIKLKKIIEYLTILKKYGAKAGEPYIKHIEGDIWELRPIDDRIFYAYYKDNIFILLHHFQKKTNKTPQREIDKAKRNLKDFLERSEKNGKDNK